MIQFPAFSVAVIRQFFSNHASNSSQLRSIFTKRLHILPQARMPRPNIARENETSASSNNNIETQVAKGSQKVEKEHGTSHQQRTAADPRQSAVHDVILSKVETTSQDIRLLRLRPTPSLSYHGAGEGKRSEPIHASHSSFLYRRLSQQDESLM